MSVKVVIKQFPRSVSGRIVRVNEECRLPNSLAAALESRGLCVIVAVGEPVAMETRVQPDTAVKTKAKKAVAKAAKTKKTRADAKKKAAKK